MPDRIVVSFDGDDSGETPLTWGQQHIWDWICRSRAPLNMSATRVLDEGATVAEFVDELRFFMTRFQAMRTRLRPDENGRPLQVVSRSGEATLEIVDVPDGADPAAVADEVSERHNGSHFDYGHEWPIRMTLVRHGDTLTHLVTTLCHVVADAAGAMVMFTDLLARDPDTGILKDPVTTGPLELAEWQQSGAGERQSNGAMLFWRKHLRAMPAAASPPTPTNTTWPSGPVPEAELADARFWQVGYTSPAMHQAFQRLADRLSCDTASILLACYATALARMTGSDPVALAVFANNRFRPGLTAAVSPVNQVALCVLELAGLTFDETVGLVRKRTLNAYKNAYYDHFQRDALIEEISRERGIPLDLECWVNDRRTNTTALPAVAEPLPASTLRSTPVAGLIKKLMLTVNDADDAITFILEADTEFMPLADVERLARELEAVAVETAALPEPPPR